MTARTLPGSRRWSGSWARARRAEDPAPEPEVDVLVPTVGRTAELATTLSGLAAQEDPPFRVILSDQSDGPPAWEAPAVSAMVRVLRAEGRPVELHRRLPRRGLADHRQFLLDRARAGAVLFLDDDVWLEPGALSRMHDALRSLGCGFVGSAVQGLSYLEDDRPEQRAPFAPWHEGVQPETVGPGSEAFGRWTLHNAANLVHLAGELDLRRDSWLAYRVAWVGGCVLYDRRALEESGGFDFGVDLPVSHVGEDVLAQWRVMARFGGAGLLPSGAVHLEAPTTLPDRTMDLPHLIAVAHDAPASEAGGGRRTNESEQKEDPR